MTLYEPGETVVLIADIFPATITPYPDDFLPANSSALVFRVLITERGLVVGYQFGGEVHKVDIPLTEEETANATYRGGQVGPYEVTANGVCRCKARMLSSWDSSQIFPASPIVQDARVDKARVESRRDSTYGLIPNRGPVRYSRT
jgi:hypothetical protein